eukprot:TRINITY_DN2560_c0_g1_i6.p2 TRINITY_DN2560_c0_g1~~TRINITY_DN2560_c0_g1_i6.p2  ORF type:complete len:109 (+),score=8.42 TRINITY_DN2560_c0_g1_i6:136-462(+)
MLGCITVEETQSEHRGNRRWRNTCKYALFLEYKKDILCIKNAAHLLLHLSRLISLFSFVYAVSLVVSTGRFLSLLLLRVRLKDVTDELIEHCDSDLSGPHVLLSLIHI